MSQSESGVKSCRASKLCNEVKKRDDVVKYCRVVKLCIGAKKRGDVVKSVDNAQVTQKHVEKAKQTCVSKQRDVEATGYD